MQTGVRELLAIDKHVILLVNQWFGLYQISNISTDLKIKRWVIEILRSVPFWGTKLKKKVLSISLNTWKSKFPRIDSQSDIILLLSP